MRMKVVIEGAHGDPKARFDFAVAGHRSDIDKGLGVVNNYLDLFSRKDCVRCKKSFVPDRQFHDFCANCAKTLILGAWQRERQN